MFPTEVLPTARGARAALAARPRAPALLCLHGAAGGAWMWAEGFAARCAAAGFLAAALDLRARRADRAESTLADYADDVRAALAALGRLVVLVGHSLGGLIAQRLLAEQAVRGAALLAPVPPEGLWWTSWRMALADPLLWLVAARMDAAAEGGPVTFLELAALRLAMFDAALPEATALRHLRRLGAESRAVQIEAHWPQPVPSALLCATPVLVIGRAGDRLVPPDAVLRAAAFHGAVPVLLDGTGHAMMLDIDWPAIADRVVGFAATITLAAHEEVSAP
jgi:pimeloyl-ACP methyl ester carboxylesterase